MTPQTLKKALQQRWQTLAPRERQALIAAALVLAGALFWWVGLAPALRTLRSTEARQQGLDAQWQQMQSLQSQAREPQQQTRLSRQEALQALESSVRQRLGTGGQLTVQGERATLVLKAVPATALAQWLSQARANARVLPAEVRLSRSNGATNAPANANANNNGAPAGKPAPTVAEPAWDGSLVLALPPA